MCVCVCVYVCVCVCVVNTDETVFTYVCTVELGLWVAWIYSAVLDSLYSGNSQCVDVDTNGSCDEHDVSINLVVLVDDSEDSLVDQHPSEDPDNHHRHQCTQDLCTGGENEPLVYQ